MKYQKGFVPLLIILIAVLGLVAGGGYVVYKDKQAETKRKEVLEKIKNFNNNPLTATTSVSATPSENPKTTPSTKVETKTLAVGSQINCGNDWSCLVTAASKCSSVTAVISFSNMRNPILQDFVNSGKTRYEIKPQGSTCVLTYVSLEASMNISEEGKVAAQAHGITAAQIESQLEIMNKSILGTLNLKTTCTDNASTIASYLSDVQKNSIGDVSVSFSADQSGSKSKSTYKTSSGKELTCYTEQPKVQTTTTTN